MTVNFKKLLLTLATLLLAGMAFAEIAIKDLGDGNVDVTFTFKDDTAPEMGVIGSFNNWTQPGDMMTKNADGLWEKTIRASSSDAITYKFFSKGTWIFDEKAPDKKDDGYGGFNGLIPVADILSGLIPAVPGAPPVLAKGPKKVLNQRPRVTFGTETYLESDTAFTTTGGEHHFTTSVINAKSLWKFDGDLAPGMPGHLEITAFNGHPKVYDNGATKLDWGTGLQEAGAGFLLNPFYYLGDNKKPTLDKVRFGFDTPYLVYETGYGNSTLPAHKSVLWETVAASSEVNRKTAKAGTVARSATTDLNKANAGYSYFALGPKAKSLGDFTIDAAVVPNQIDKDSYYGLYSFASVEAYGVRVEGQYEMRSSTKTDVGKFFEKPSRQNVILGAEVYFDDFLFQGQFLNSGYPVGGVTDKRPAGEKMAYKAVAGLRDVYGDSEWLAGYSYRGGTWDTAELKMQPTASMLYAYNDDVLGAPGTAAMSLEGFQKFGYWGQFNLESSFVMPTSGNLNKDQVAHFKPGFLLHLEPLRVYPVSVEAFFQASYHTAPATGSDALQLAAFGAKAKFQDLELFYKSDLADTKLVLHSLLVEAAVAPSLKAQLGAGLRSGSKALSTAGLVLGLSYLVPAPEARTPTVYGQFVYNMDPYNTEGRHEFDLTDLGPTNGAAGADGVGALRVGIRWDY